MSHQKPPKPDSALTSEPTPCPFCGEKPSHVECWDEGRFGMVCYCDARGPEVTGDGFDAKAQERKAIAAWNRRAFLSRSGPAEGPQTKCDGENHVAFSKDGDCQCGLVNVCRYRLSQTELLNEIRVAARVADPKYRAELIDGLAAAVLQRAPQQETK